MANDRRSQPVSVQQGQPRHGNAGEECDTAEQFGTPERTPVVRANAAMMSAAIVRLVARGRPSSPTADGESSRGPPIVYAPPPSWALPLGWRAATAKA